LLLSRDVLLLMGLYLHLIWETLGGREPALKGGICYHSALKSHPWGRENLASDSEIP